MNKTVLFVDDEPSILTAVEGIFEALSEISVVTALNGELAMEVLATEPVGVVVSDLVMPGMDGIALLSKIQKLYPDIAVMVMSGYTESSPRAREALGDDIQIIPKPWDVDDLIGRVRGAFDGGQPSGEDEQKTLLEFGGVTQKEIDRANRIRERMQSPPSLGEVLIELGSLGRDEYQRIVSMRRSKMSLAALLHEDGHLGDEDLKAYEQAKEETPGIDDRELLVDNEMVTEEQFLRALADKHIFRYVEPEVGIIDADILGRTSFRYLQKQCALPVSVIEGKLTVILNDPLDNQLITELERILGNPIAPACCTREKIREALHTLERLKGGGQSEEGGSQLQYREIEDVAEGEDAGKEAVEVVDYLLLRAIQLGASDLHIEPMQKKVRVRLRIDGVLQQLTELPVDVASRIASRIKILAGADIAEKRQHQDGKIFVKVEGREIDIRVSSYVTIYGENLVLRLLDRNRNILSLDNIGFNPRVRSVIEDVVLATSSGLVIITGPTGSGKTTTLYTMIEHALDPTEKVITCEDPVEYVIDGVIQCSVNSKTGPTFGDSLRAIVRQDPDVILVGEMRDEETASLAFESALTGHKVFSTFHTEDAVTVIVRLIEMGLEPFLVSSSLATVIAQRLMRRVCDRCKQPARPTRTQLRFLGLDPAQMQGVRLWEGKGCGECNGSGYKGRLGVHEVLIPNDDFRDAVVQQASAKDLRKIARLLPEFMTMQEDALLKAADGHTTLAEIVDNVPRDVHCRPISQLKTLGRQGRNA